MFGTWLFNRRLSLEFRNGFGFDLEFTDSRAVWVLFEDDGTVEAMSFEGIVIMLPFFLLTYGRVYHNEVVEDE